ncbi:uncharacterized protein BCR38DRAFT_140030 [Pseudomassariella vexata]|uniref:Uncharacterized protein n=1 Tax=Pseudomassariella vexata TaxID=1141098 RepID=A0A1Y2EC48_9PEZI|nr:uncharacterized protein BCR38DRAFT_140030 [Pseudomassariella vexata]ORY68836.1 hypothetical protein BCR38DRAFT_140030 [Pseudomassariella vexata]
MGKSAVRLKIQTKVAGRILRDKRLRNTEALFSLDATATKNLVRMRITLERSLQRSLEPQKRRGMMRLKSLRIESSAAPPGHVFETLTQSSAQVAFRLTKAREPSLLVPIPKWDLPLSRLRRTCFDRHLEIQGQSLFSILLLPICAQWTDEDHRGSSTSNL